MIINIVFGFLICERKSIKASKINQEITANPVLLIDDEGKSQGIVSLDQAMYLAFEKSLDLILINEKSKPAVCKIMDHGKYLYSQSKLLTKQKSKTHESEIKEIRFGVKIDEHDLEVKIAKIKKFLGRGDKVKLSVKLKGREMMFASQVQDLVNRVVKESGGIIDKPVEKMGSRFFAVITSSTRIATNQTPNKN